MGANSAGANSPWGETGRHQLAEKRFLLNILSILLEPTPNVMIFAIKRAFCLGLKINLLK